MPMWVIVVGTPLSLALAVWVFIGTMRVNSGRAKNLIEGMTPQRIVIRRLTRQIQQKHGR